MTGRLPIRVRLTIWYSCVLVLALAATGWAAWLAARHSLLASVDQMLSDRAAEISNVLRTAASESRIFDERAARAEVNEYVEETAGGRLLQVLGPDGKFLVSGKTPSLAAAFPWTKISQQTGPGNIRFRGHQYRVYVKPVEVAGTGYTIVTASSLEEIDDGLEHLVSLLLFILPILAVLASAGGYWISSRALAPVAAMTAAARAIGIHNLSQRLPVPAARDELQALSRTWNETLSRLETAVSRLAQFTADASHELRTPVALIRTTAELALRRPRSAEEYRESLSRVHIESERMSELVEDLLVLARADVGVHPFPMSEVNLSGIVKEAGIRGAVLAAAKRIAMDTRVPQTPVLVRGNEAALRRLLLLLIDNAVKYTPEGGKVTLSLEVNKGRASAVVADTGMGITPDVLPHIFDRFYRADDVRGPEAGGAGLGLSIAKWIADEHRVEIQVSSTPGEGSQFRVIFPESKTPRDSQGIFSFVS